MGEAFYISLLVPLPMTLLARWGGEEFVVLLPHTPLEYARQLAERMRVAVAFATQPCAPMDAVHVTVSIGTAGMAADESMILDDLVQAADLAMYVAKRSGCNQVSRPPPATAAHTPWATAIDLAGQPPLAGGTGQHQRGVSGHLAVAAKEPQSAYQNQQAH